MLFMFCRCCRGRGDDALCERVNCFGDVSLHYLCSHALLRTREGEGEERCSVDCCNNAGAAAPARCQPAVPAAPPHSIGHAAARPPSVQAAKPAYCHMLLHRTMPPACRAGAKPRHLGCCGGRNCTGCLGCNSATAVSIGHTIEQLTQSSSGGSSAQ